MQIGIPKESFAGETRVAATPATVIALQKLGFSVLVESGAGEAANFADEAYVEAGAEIGKSSDVWACSLIYKVLAPNDDEIEAINPGTTLVSFIWPRQNPELIEKLNAKKITVLAMDMVPRISRAQALDALSTTANISGYRAVVEAAHEFGRFFCGQVTAAGKVPPAKVLVIGAGVAGLAAIGAASSLGAIVRAFDTRLEVADQIHSMGGEFLKLNFKQEDGGSSDGYAKTMSPEFIKAEMELFAEQAKEVDIIITTAAIPGKKAPLLVTADMVASMKSGSVIVDLAAATGGNCECTVPGQVALTTNGVKIIGYTDLPCRLPTQSSQLYSTNLVNLTKLLCKEKDGNIDVNFDDVVLRNMTIVRDGEVTFPPPQISVSVAPQKPAAAPVQEEKKPANPLFKYLALAGIVALMFLVGAFAPESFLPHFTVFVLSCVVGYYVVWNVSHSLHTPLMAVTNAVSGIIVVGALAQLVKTDAYAPSAVVYILCFVAILIAFINIFGGFAVTKRMLKMFRKD